MPTENRSSNTEMVSKPTADQPVDTFRGDNQHLISCIKALLTLDAKGSLIPHGIGGHARELLSSAAVRLGEQHQDEPVAWLVTGTGMRGAYINDPTHWAHGYSVKPLYPREDAGEVERLRAKVEDLRQSLTRARKAHASSQGILQEHVEALNAKLAERDALLREAACHATRMEPMSASCLNRIDAVLDASSASAEPSAPKCGVCGQGAWACNEGGYHYLESGNGAPVERDERADFDEWFRKENGLHPEADTTFIGAAFMPYRAWKARAALERKP